MRHTLRTLLFLLFGTLGMTLVGCQPGVSPILAATCSTTFEATVYQGPSTGTKLTGDFNLRISSIGELSGLLHTADDKDVTVTGQANGHALNLVFNVGDQQYIFGSGAAQLPVYECAGVWGGGFTGPQPGDSGDWLVKPISGGTKPPINFTCGQKLGNLCQCSGAADCADLGQSGICKDKISFKDPNTQVPTGDTGYCIYQ